VTPPPAHPLDAWARLWLQLAGHGAALGLANLKGAARLMLLGQLRERWLAELTHTTDHYLRSPTFLELMRFNLNTTMRMVRSTAPPRPPHGQESSRCP
jgi:hypothetical protein